MRVWVEPLGWMLVQSVWLISVIVGVATTETARGDQSRQAKAEGQPVATTEPARIVFLNDIEMRAEQSGNVVSLKVAASAKVKKGDTLAVVRYYHATAPKPEEMIAPFDGEVVKVFVREMDPIKPSQVLVRIVQFDRVVVEGELDLAGRTPRELIGKVEVVQVEQDTFTIQGKVTFIDQEADANGNHRIRVEVENRQKDGKWLLVPGRLTKLTILKGDDRRIRTEREALGTFRGVVTIEGVRPKLPPLNLVKRPVTIPGLRELPDESLLIGEKGGLANVVVYLKQAPPNWLPTPPPTEPSLIESINARFSPRMSILRVGQRLKLKNSMSEAVNLHSHPLRSQAINMMGPANGEHLVDPKHSQSENLPYPVKNDIYPWMQSWIVVLDHPFVAITDSEGRFEIAGLPPGDYEFRVWHEQGGYLEKKLPIHVTSGQVTDLALRYGYDFEASETSKLIPAANATPLMKVRAERLKANDPEAGKKLVGLWKVTMTRGDVFGAEVTQTEDGCLKVKARSFAGTYAVNGNRVELLEARWDRVDVVWEVQSEGSLKLIVYGNEVKGMALGTVLERPKPGEVIPNLPVPSFTEARAERLKANDREAAKKLVGLWKLTFPAGFQSEGEFTQTEDGCLKFEKGRVFHGMYLMKGNRVELVDEESLNRPAKTDHIDFVWEVQADGSLKLIVDRNHASATYLGAVLERLKPGEVIPKPPEPAVPDFTAVRAVRAERRQANDREAAKKLVGLWKLTLPRGFKFDGKFTQTEDGCLKLDKVRVVNGTYAVKGNRVELVDYKDLNNPKRANQIDFVWEVQADGSLKLIVDKNDNWARYLGAVLERVPADAPKNDADAQADAKNVNEKIGSGLVPGQFTGAGQVI